MSLCKKATQCVARRSKNSILSYWAVGKISKEFKTYFNFMDISLSCENSVWQRFYYFKLSLKNKNLKSLSFLSDSEKSKEFKTRFKFMDTSAKDSVWQEKWNVSPKVQYNKKCKNIFNLDKQTSLNLKQNQQDKAINAPYFQHLAFLRQGFCKNLSTLFNAHKKLNLWGLFEKFMCNFGICRVFKLVKTCFINGFKTAKIA